MPRVSCYRCPHCQKLFETKGAYKDHLLDMADEITNTLNSFIRDAKDLGIGIVQQYNDFTQTIRFETVVMKGEDDK